MRDEMKKVPRLRFRGFSEDWELCKLGQVANYRRGSFPQPYGNKEWYDGENSMPFVQVVDVGDNLRLVEDTKQKISELAQPKSVFVKEGKVVVTLQGSIGRVAITQYPAYVDRTLLIFESYKAEMDEYYFAYVIQQLFEYEKTRAPGGTIKTVTKEALSDFTISFPSIEEQKKLGKFFEQLDDTITLHQRKLDQLKELKKAYLQLMFPKKDETVPRVRFADFEDDWQLCKLGDVVEIFDGTHQTPRYTDSGVKFVSVENIATLETKKYITHEAYEKEYSKKRAKKGDILMTRIGDIGTMKVIETDEPLAYYVTLALLKAKETNPYFLSFIISSPEIQRNIWKRTLHIAFPKKINLGEINQVEMKITIFEEQDKIGDLFTNLDDAIILNQNKLNQLKSLKKSYLQNMFI
ncbi:restriction endonuclease subunit S [Enterococcus faecalis]|uniref:restriction endonuclease subunit S n=1 Tax=Enterococcus faecalis TaxID=1351 RepID=UPI00156D854D|nr:restriction endonuclease subunit S [Enterococcus faecalis]EGO8906267.1 restriction endonuclease subunit S [Enterococcus faecalis]EJC3748053.1 restriction endonuclease subunit S [Enterococcus faecalis]MCP9739127.1 restriction endonuclease subunit S [Enterococcus faecalis]NSN10281.1 restriction endonuclease subunit S [Enterococcus faecalis]